MPDTFNCPNCGAPLDYKGSDPIIRCPYCSTSVVVPENLRAKPSFSSQPSNFTLNGMGDMGELIQKARRIKDVKDLAQAGQMEKAVSLYREITDASHHDAEIAVQSLAQGRAITLSNFAAADVYARARQQYVAPPPAQSIQQPLPQIQIQTPAARPSSRVGCLVGCFVTGLVLFILASVLIPIVGSALPLLIQAEGMPDALQTALPEIATALPEISTAMPQVIPTVHHFAEEKLNFGGEGTGPGLFKDPRAIAVDPKSGNIYVADYQGGRVQAFDADGKFITQWKLEDKKSIITAMAADRKGNVYVCSIRYIYRYEGASGKLLDKITANTDVFTFDDITPAADGTFFAIGGGETILHLDANGKTLLSIPKAISTVTEETEALARIAVDGEGNIFVLGRLSNAVFKFNEKGKYINKFGSDGDQEGQFRAPYAIAVDGHGNVYVSDIKGIQVFDGDGRYIDLIDPEGVAFGLIFDDQNNLYIASNASKVFKFAISK